MVVSQPVLAEILQVLGRPELTMKFRRIAGLDLSRVIELISQVDVVEIGNIKPVSRDPKDNKFLATAKAALASYIVSEDNDLLTLKEYEGAKIVTAATFLGILEGTADRPATPA